MIAVVDYKKGNIRSVVRGIEGTGAHVEVIDSVDALKSAKAIVLPGVGAFRDAMESLSELGLVEPLVRAIEDGVPYLGICLGMHILFEGGMEHAEEGNAHPGLGLLPGVVDRLPAEGYGEDGELHRFKLPHVGWNTVSAVSESEQSILTGLEDEEYFYFTHSFACPESTYTVAETRHSIAFPSIVRKDDAWGVQFHPEKSSAAGAKLLQNFVDAYTR